jgi:ornithine cyclodeaminase
MSDSELLIIKGVEVLSLLANRELEIVRLVQEAYEAHALGRSSLPHSVFLRFPNDQRNRIIALPGYLDGEFNIAGIKWISSFPGNHEIGQDRASAVVILNSMATGRPFSILEGSIISAKRTAASAALAASRLQGDEKATVLSLIGCGVINFEVARFVLATCREIKSLVVFDKDKSIAEQFKTRCEHEFEGVGVRVVEELDSLLSNAELISLATTASEPHIFDLSMCAEDCTVLNVSLRDLAAEVILESDNVVDDVDHVCRAQTSVHLAEQVVGNRDFIRCTLPEVTSGLARPRQERNKPVIFSPFGLGVLDLALGQFVYELARKEKLGTAMSQFLPPSQWTQTAKGNAA